MKKLITILLLGFFMISLTSAFDWNDNVLSYYKLNEASGTVIDSEGNFNLINDGATYGATGKLGNAYDFEFDNTDSVNGTNIDPDDHNQALSFNAWFKAESLPASEADIMGYNDDGSWGSIRTSIKSDGAIRFRFGSDAGAGSEHDNIRAGIISTGQWYMITITHNETRDVIYINGTEVGTFVSGNLQNNGNTFYIGNSNNNAFFDGIVDEVGIWNKTLTPTDITDLYNSGNGLIYGSSNNQEITLTSPTNKSSIPTNGQNFISTLNITDYQGINETWKNVTYTIWNSNGTIFNQTSIDVPELNGTTSNLTINNFEELKIYKWGITAYRGNDTYTNFTTSENFTFYTYITINILNSNNNHIELVNINCSSKSINIDVTSPYKTKLSTFTSLDNESIDCIFKDQNNYNADNTTTINFSKLISEYNISMGSKSIKLNFFQQNGSVANVTGFYSNLTSNVDTFENISFIQILRSLSQGRIFVKWAFNDSLLNYTQHYEFENDWITDTEENITILNKGDVRLFIKVISETSRPIEDALVRIDIANYSSNNTYGIIGQRFTNADGYTDFYTDDGSSAVIRVTANGYNAKTIPFTDFSLNDHSTEATALPITLEKGAFNVTDWSSLSIIKNFDPNTTEIINFFIYSPTRTNVKYITQYAEDNGLSNKSFNLNNLKQGLGSISITENHWVANTTNDITLKIYIDNTLWRKIVIKNNDLDTSKFNKFSGLNSGTEKFLLWIALITITALIGLFLKGDDEIEGGGDYGKMIFFIGCVIIAFINFDSFKWLAGVVGLYFALTIARKWVSE